MQPALNLTLTRSEGQRLLDLVVQSPESKGKHALTRQLQRLVRRDTPDMRLRVADKSAAYLGIVFRLNEQDPLVAELSRQAIHNLKAVRRDRAIASANEVTLNNPKSDTRDRTVRHLTGRPRPPR